MRCGLLGTTGGAVELLALAAVVEAAGVGAAAETGESAVDDEMEDWVWWTAGLEAIVLVDEGGSCCCWWQWRPKTACWRLFLG